MKTDGNGLRHPNDENDSRGPVSYKAMMRRVAVELQETGELSEATYAELFERFKRWVHAHPLRHAVERHVTSHDLAQDALIALRNCVDSGLRMDSLPEELSGLFYRIVVFRVISQVRKRYARPGDPVPIDEDTPWGAEVFGARFQTLLARDYEKSDMRIRKMIDDLDEEDALKYGVRLRLIERLPWTEVRERVDEEYPDNTVTDYRIRKHSKAVGERAAREIHLENESWEGSECVDDSGEEPEPSTGS